MLDLSIENKNLCFEDSIQKPLYIFLYYWQEDNLDPNDGWWQYFTTIDKAIVLESAETTEGVLEGNNFELGSFVIPSMKVQWQNNGIRYKDMVAVPVQKIGDQYIAYFDGYISSEEISQDGQTVSAEIVSFLGERLDIDVLENVKQATGTTFANVLQYSLSSNAGIWLDENKLLSGFANANTTINLNTETLPQTLTANELLKQAGEFLGGHIVVKEKRVVDIDDMENYQPSTMPIVDFIRFSNIDTVEQSNTKPLPSGYKRLEYIQTDGTQYINTGYIPNSSTKIEMQFYNFAKYLDVSNPANPTLHTTALFGARTSQTTKSYSLFASVYKLNEFMFDISNSRVVIDQTPLYKQKISTQTDKITINGITKPTNVASFDCEYPLYLFSVNTAGSFDERCALGKLYSFKIYENDILQRDMIPCIRISDNKLGLYDIINGNFYVDENGSDFIAPNPIETYTLPYYINLRADKSNRVQFDQIRVLTKTGDMLNYQWRWKDNIKATYEIKDNIFFEALSAQYWQYCENAVTEVGAYLGNQNLYYTDLQTVYPPFIEGGDYLIVPHQNQKLLPQGLIALDGIKFQNQGTQRPYYQFATFTGSQNLDIELSISFTVLGDTSHIISPVGGYDKSNRNIALNYYNGILEAHIGEYVMGMLPDFTIENVPKNQRINLNIKISGDKCIYSGTYSGEAAITNTTGERLSVALGSNFNNTNFTLHSFSFVRAGDTMERICIPCLENGIPSLHYIYGLVENTKPIEGAINAGYEYGDTVIPVLSCSTKGIHSIRANILCKATNVIN